MGVVRHVEHVMGTAISFDVRAVEGEDERARALIASACAVLHADDRLFSTWREDSAIRRIHRGELSLWDAPGDVAAVFDRCLLARTLSGGWFDPWTVGGHFDPTGLVKGWSGGRALRELRDPGVLGAMVNAGGDVACFGEPEAGRAWRVGVRDPSDARRALYAVQPAGAVATSGSYERGPHIYDPFTGRPAQATASATVTGTDLDLVDALATALAAAGAPVLALIDRMDDIEGCVVLAGGSLRATSGFPFVA
jgi:thiamine biosynthesis lipoprotein